MLVDKVVSLRLTVSYYAHFSFFCIYRSPENCLHPPADACGTFHMAGGVVANLGEVSAWYRGEVCFRLETASRKTKTMVK